MINKFGSKIGGRSGLRVTWTSGEALEHLQKAHSFLAKQGKMTLNKVIEFDANGEWGVRVKRKGVICPPNDLLLIANDGVTHNLAEVVNMCATVKRLIDALEWAKHSEFKDWIVEVCHPTQTSGKNENDLMLVSPVDEHRRACFEISDVAASSDGNDKETKDLVSLGVLKRCAKTLPIVESLEIDVWPPNRLFLVVSAEFATFLLSDPSPRRVWLNEKAPHCHYEQRFPDPSNHIQNSSATVILQILKGRKN